MIVDFTGNAQAIAQGNFDVCVVGSGPAGIILSRKLAAGGLSVALMEAGGLDYDQRSQDLYAGDCIGRDYYPLDSTRLRYFGGTSGHWGGLCRPLEPWDFSARPYLDQPGWPISRAALDPFADEADEAVGIPNAGAYPDRFDRFGGEDFRVVRFRHSAPLRFGDAYREEIRSSGRITLALNANLVDLELDPDLSTVVAARFKSYEQGDPGSTVNARAYCLCMGGLENPRFLLNATRQIPVGIGNEHDLVGRGFCEHPAYSMGKVLFTGEVPTSREYEPAPEVMEHERIADFHVLVSTKARSVAKELTRGLVCTTDFTARLARSIAGLELNCDAGGIGTVFGRQDPDVGYLGLIIEQSINPDSRVTLSDRRDQFGLRRIALDWRYSETDLRTLQAGAMSFARTYAANDAGRVQLKDWLLAKDVAPPQLGTGNGEVGLHHHMCTTRMGAEPAGGVVDPDCRVHSVSNLYLGGASVFAGGGYANPTYTIVELALRLGHHLTQTLAA